MDSFRAIAKNILLNGIGTKTKYKLVAFLVDDYGGVRTRDKNALTSFRNAGISEQSRYLHDTLANKEDLSRLFEVLSSVKDNRGHYACFTPLTNIANPDFETIKKTGFKEYHREPFTKTLEKYGISDALDLWKQGIAEDIFHPEYHGTEHIDIRSFMRAIQTKHKSSMLSFENNSTCCPLLPEETNIGYTTKTFHIEKASENESLKEDISVGIKMFQDIIGYSPKIFTPGACEYSPVLHQHLLNEGIRYIDVQRYRLYPLGDGKYERQYLYNGKRNVLGQYYFVRNAAFEPIRYNTTYFDGCVDFCLKKTEGAFALHCPAIISSHRVNFVSGIEPKQGEYGLKRLKELLDKIMRRWPDVVFVNGSEMMDILFSKKRIM